MKNLPKKFDIVDVLIWMLLAIALFLLINSHHIQVYYNFQQEPLRTAAIRVKELTNSDYVAGEVTYWNSSGESNTISFGDLNLNYFGD